MVHVIRVVINTPVVLLAGPGLSEPQGLVQRHDPNVSSRARPGTFAGAFRKGNPLSDGVAKPMSQFCVYVRKERVRMIPRQKKAETRGRKERREGEGGSGERNESCCSPGHLSQQVKK